MDQQPFAIIAGVGAGTGASLARRFAKQYPVALLARSTTFSSELASQIEADGGTAVSYQVDVSDENSVKTTFSEIQKEFGTKCAAALFNASSRPFPKPFLWQSEGDLSHALDINLCVELARKRNNHTGWAADKKRRYRIGAYLFAQATLPLLLSAKGSPDLVPTLIFTGATGAVKANAWMQSFAVSKHALRALAQSLSREFGPQGVHVSHVIVDGVIRMPLTWWLKPFSSWDAKLDPDAIADSYWYLHTQPLSHMTSEIAIRPYCETW